jgi:hypothetical protein
MPLILWEASEGELEFTKLDSCTNVQVVHNLGKSVTGIRSRFHYLNANTGINDSLSFKTIFYLNNDFVLKID